MKDIKLKQNPYLEIRLSPIHYRGVYVNSKIKKGNILEQCPMVPLTNRSRYQNDQTIWDYLYANKNCDCKECQVHGVVFYMILGYGMIYNHGEKPNASWEFNYDDLIATLMATEDIEENTEILVSYGPDYFKTRPGYNQTSDAKNN